ncbi:hypothetical protein KFU94_39335 [Chloroflexi bacterium TSY]|nr:hypothetical protein [Chloroflexi bacterium TSY]
MSFDILCFRLSLWSIGTIKIQVVVVVISTQVASLTAIIGENLIANNKDLPIATLTYVLIQVVPNNENPERRKFCTVRKHFNKGQLFYFSSAFYVLTEAFHE